MSKVRVHELAKQLGMESKEVLAKLQELGEFVRSASSTVEPPVARKLIALYPDAKPAEEKKPVKKAAAKKAVAAKPEVNPELAAELAAELGVDLAALKASREAEQAAAAAAAAPTPEAPATPAAPSTPPVPGAPAAPRPGNNPFSAGAAVPRPPRPGNNPFSTGGAVPRPPQRPMGAARPGAPRPGAPRPGFAARPGARVGRGPAAPAPPAAVPAVPVRPWRVLLSAGAAFIVIVAWRVADANSSQSASISDPPALILLMLLLVCAAVCWRALARLGYASPLVTVQGLLRAPAQVEYAPHAGLRKLLNRINESEHGNSTPRATAVAAITGWRSSANSVRWLAAARKDSGAGECEYSSRK